MYREFAKFYMSTEIVPSYKRRRRKPCLRLAIAFTCHFYGNNETLCEHFSQCVIEIEVRKIMITANFNELAYWLQYSNCRAILSASIKKRVTDYL